MKRVLDFITKNFLWKAIALVLAILLWFVAMNISNPMKTDTLDIPLTVLNAEKLQENGFVLLNEESLENRTIYVTVRASRIMIETLDSNKRDIKATIDLSPIDITYEKELGEPISLTVNVQLPSYLTIDKNYQELEDSLSIRPNKVDIILDRFDTRIFPVSVNVNGDPEDGYVATTPVCDPDEVEVSGAATYLDRIEAVRAVIDVRGAREDVVSTETLVAYNYAGEEETDVALNVSEALIRVPIDKYKRVEVIPTVIGQVADGYVITKVDVNPAYLEVVGLEADVNMMSSITLLPVSVENLSETRTFPAIDLRPALLETKVSVRNGTEYEVAVTVHIAKEGTKELVVSTENLQIIGMGNTVEIPSDVIVTIVGLESEIEDITAEQLFGSLDLSGLGPGDHMVPVIFDLPEGVSTVGEPLVQVVITESTSGGLTEQEEPEEDPGPTVEPEDDNLTE